MSSIFLYYDSQAIMSKIFSKIYNEKSKHINLRHEYIRQSIYDGKIIIVYVRSCNNLVDFFTKRSLRRFSYKHLC